MKYIITESQEKYLGKFNTFLMFMKRRDDVIRELIAKFAKRPRTSKHRVLDDVLVELSNMNDVDNESEMFDSIYEYLNDNYMDYIEEKLKK
jgi:hypothetical protein